MESNKQNKSKKPESQLAQLYDVAADTSVSVIVEGVHGIGKSESVYEFAERNDFHVEPLFLSHQEVADLIGIPTLEKDENGHPLTTWSKPIWLHRLEIAAKNGKRPLLFLDELNRAQSEVRQAALQLVLDKMIHEHKLPEVEVNGMIFPTFVVAAVNPADGFYQVDELDPALLDRFLHFELKVNANNWIDWASRSGVHPTIISYISANKDKLYLRDENVSIFPTPRSWTKLSELLYSLERKNISSDQTLHNIITGKIGYVVGAQFMTYYKESSVIVTIDDVIAIVENNYEIIAEKHGEATVKTVSTVGKIIEKELIDVEIPIMRELSSNIVEKYLKSSGKMNFDEGRVLICYLYALPLEQLAALIKDIQIKSNENHDSRYDNLAVIAPEKDIFRRIVKVIKRLALT